MARTTSSTGNRLQVPPVRLDRTAAEPLHRQIARQIEAAIRTGTIGGEVRLPSTRCLARILGISRNTVVAAYEELVSAGLVRAIRGAGVRVTGHAPLSGMPLAGLKGVIAAARFPSSVLHVEDADGNPLYIRY